MASATPTRQLRHAASTTPLRGGSVRKIGHDNGSAGAEDEAEEQKKEAPFRYEHLPEEKLFHVDAILKGDRKLGSLPFRRKKMVRIFISSTFTDMKKERNELIAKAYPQLREYCRNKHGIEFQVVDMRWGIQDQARDEHTTMELCINEIHHCQKVSVGPNFVGFVGQKQGQMDLVSCVPAEEFERIREELVKRNTDVSILDKWYRQDKNEIKSVYVLQPISSIIGDTKDDWFEISKSLRGLLLTGARHAAENGKIAPDRLCAFNSSVTEKEIDEGLLNVSTKKERDANCILVVRDIEDILDFQHNPIVHRFIDIANSSSDITEIAAEKLRQKIFASKLSDSNVLKKRVTWNELQTSSGEDEFYVKNVVSFFISTVKRLIDKNMHRELSLVSDELYDEALQHWILARTRCRFFVGRNDIIQKIRHYILSDTDDRILVIHGESGYGKTSLMAKAAHDAIDWLVKDGKVVNSVVAVRFCGTTPGSSKIAQMLKSICHQIAYVTGKLRHTIPQEYKELKRHFLQMTSTCDYNGTVVIFLDALDQLSPDDSAHNLDWLQSKIAKNVKIIVSTLPEKYDILKRLQRKIEKGEYFVPLDLMETKVCYEIVMNWLRNRGRTLTQAQIKVLKSTLTHCSSALFTKLTFEDVIRWKSYTGVDEKSLGKSVEQCINVLFRRIEDKHGKVLVERFFGYITASNHGLSIGELEDILSLDDEVLNSIFKFWEPPIRRIPTVLLTRIHYDIDQFLVEREAHGVCVIYWYHRQFEQVATQTYLNDASTVQKIHSIMSDYYLGIWSGDRKKPFRYQEFLMKRLKLKDANSAEVRHVPEQPLIFHQDNAVKTLRTVYNLRKMAMLPYHLYFSHRKKELNDIVYFNYEWLHRKLPATSVQQVLTDFNLCNDYEVGLVADAFRMSEKVLSANPDALAIEITGRLLPHYTSWPNVRRLIDQCDRASIHHCPILANRQLYTAPGGPLQFVCDHQLNGNGSLNVKLIRNFDSTLLTVKSMFSDTVKIWDISIGEAKRNMRIGQGELYPTVDGRYACIFKTSQSLEIFNAESGEVYGEVEYGYGKVTTTAIGSKYIAFCNDGRCSPIVIDIINKKLVHQFQYQSNIVALSPDEKFILCSHGKILAVFELPNMERRCVVTMNNEPAKVAFTTESSHFILISKEKEVVSYVVNFVKRKATPQLLMRDMELRTFNLSNSRGMALVQAARSLYVFDMVTNKLNYRIHEMPPGEFLEKQSVFMESFFTANDVNVIASRHRHIGVWDGANGSPLRLIQVSFSPIEKLFALSTDNKAVTVCRDRSIQVWNLDNLQGDVRHLNHIALGKIVKIMPSINKGKCICFAKRSNEAQIVDTFTGNTISVLTHSPETSVYILNATISHDCKHATTLADKPSKIAFTLPQELVLWNLENNKQMDSFESVKDSMFSPSNDYLVVTKSRFSNKRDWADNSYNVSIVHLQTKETKSLDLPDGEVVSDPVISSDGRFVVYILQTCTNQQPIPQSITDRNFCLRLVLIELNKAEVILKTIQELWPEIPGEKSDFVAVKAMTEDRLAVTYGTNLPIKTPKDDAFHYLKSEFKKGIFVFSLTKSGILCTYKKFLNPDSSLQQTLINKNLTVAVDNHGISFDILKGKMKYDLSIKVTRETQRLAVNGKYLVALSKNRQDLHVVRISDGLVVVSCPVHGEASCIEIGEDEKTVFVGTTDGRVMMLTLILEDTDVKGTIKEIRDRTVNAARESAMMKTIVNMAMYSRSHQAMDKSLSQNGKKVSFRRLSQAVLASKAAPKVSSRACSIQ